MKYDVPFIRPVLPRTEVISRDVDEIVASNWFTNFGPKEREFSTEIAGYVGKGITAVTFANATLGLIAALQALVPKRAGGSVVLVASFTFAAGPAAIEWAGHEAMFIDIDPVSMQPSLESARTAMQRYGDRIGGVLLTNTFGIGNTAIHDWEEFARNHNVPLVVDSAAGFGSLYADGTKVGNAGACEVFSFHATKPFAIGEGGAVVTHDADLAARLRAFTNFGFASEHGADFLGTNAKLQEINAAIGLRQLESFDGALDDRRKTFLKMQAAVDSSRYQFPTGIERSAICFVSATMPTLELRNKKLAQLHERGIEARKYYYPPVHLQPHFSQVNCINDLPGTMQVSETVLSIPLHQSMEKVALQAVIDGLNEEVQG